jgi:hypothetical protein
MRQLNLFKIVRDIRDGLLLYVLFPFLVSPSAPCKEAASFRHSQPAHHNGRFFLPLYITRVCAFLGLLCTVHVFVF